MAKLWKQGKFLKTEIYSQEWNKLTDTEKANIRSAIAELGMALGSFIASVLLVKLAEEAPDEDDEKLIYSLAYLLRRQYGELAFYTPLGATGESLRFMKSPSAAFSTLELFHKTYVQLFEDLFNLDLERYERGQHVGDSKSYVNMQKLFNPFYKQFVAKDVKKSYQYLVNANTM